MSFSGQAAATRGSTDFRPWVATAHTTSSVGEFHASTGRRALHLAGMPCATFFSLPVHLGPAFRLPVLGGKGRLATI